MQAVHQQQPVAALAALDQAWEAGVQPGQLARQLIDAWRARLKVAVGEKGGAAQVTSYVTAIETLLPVLRSAWPELALEAALARLASDAAQPSTRPVTMQLSQPAAVTAPAAPAAPATATPAPTASPAEAPSGDMWLKALTQIKQRNNSLYALLRSCTLEFREDEVVIGCKFGFFRDRLQEGKNIQIIEQALARVYGRKLKVTPQLESKPATVAASPDTSEELMSSALEILGGEVMGE
jgi:hypothetical protein